jgi:hypothetical protein
VCKKYAAEAGEVYGRLPEAEGEAADEDDDHHNIKMRNCKQAVHHDVHEFTSMQIEV